MAGVSKARDDALRSLRAAVAPHSVDPGDAVELVSRDGSVQFGVVSFTLPDGSFDCITAQGGVAQACVSDVAFVMRGMLPPQPSGRYSAQDVSAQLQKRIARSYARRLAYVPLLRVVYANMSLDDRPRAVDFEDVCNQIARFMSPYDATMPADRVDRLAVYLAMAYHALFFVRTGRSPFTAVTTGTLDAVQKVMHALTQTELEHGVSQMRLRSPSWLGTVLHDFLEHWALWNDPRLARAVVAILEKNESYQRALDSPHAISSALGRLGGIRLFPWVQHEAPAPGPSMPASSAEAVVSQRASAGTAGATSPAPTESPLFTTNLAKDCVLLDRNTAVGLEKDGLAPRLSVYVPYVVPQSSILGRLSPVGTRARTIRLGGRVVPMLPHEVAERHAFKHGVPRQALRLSVQYDRKTLCWDAASASHSVVEVLPHDPGRTSCPDLSGVRSVLSVVDPVLSEHELQLSGREAGDASEAGDVDAPAVEMQGVPGVQGVLATQAQAAAGRIAALAAQIHGIEVPYLGMSHGREELGITPQWHERLAVHAYAPVGRPLDSSLALLTQQQLTRREQLPRLTASGRPRAPLVAKLKETVEPQLRLAEALEERDEKYWALRNLELQLQESAMFHIYRCVVLQASSQRGGHLVPAFCLDLNINVEVFVPAHTEQIYPGDQVIGTEILELDALQGLFIVSI